MTHSGADHAKLIEAVNQYNEQADAKNAAMAEEFSEICGAHVDYLWDRTLTRPE